MNETAEFKEVYSILKQKYEDSQFTQFMDDLIIFYGRKVMRFAKSETQRNFIEEEFHRLVKSQFFVGYRAMYIVLEEPEVKLPEDLFKLAPGTLRNEIPILVANLFKDLEEEWYRVKEAQEISMWLTQNIEGTYDVLHQIKKDCTMFGCYYAVLDRSQYKKEAALDSVQMYKFGEPFDLQFLNPQVYMVASTLTKEQEIWEIYNWSSLANGGAWTGKIHLYLKEGIWYILDISLMNTIHEDEMSEITFKISSLLPEELRPFTQIRLNHLSDFTLFAPTSVGAQIETEEE